MGILEPLGILSPESLFGFGVRGVEFTPAFVRAEIVCAFGILGGEPDFAWVDALAAYGVDS